MHGHAPRVRRRINREESVQKQEDDSQIVVDRDKLISTVASAAIGGVVGSIVTESIRN